MSARVQDFMNGVCTDILHMHKKGITTYKGNFDTYVVSRAQAEDLQMKKYAAEQEQVRTDSCTDRRNDRLPCLRLECPLALSNACG